MKATRDIHVLGIDPLLAPNALKAELPMSKAANRTVIEAREAIAAILDARDPRMLVCVGPCSIHDEKAALDYAERLKAVAEKTRERLLVAMRVYFEKPRTTVGWKGFINDPFLNDTFDMEEGLRRAWRLLMKINEMGLAAATEMLDPITAQYTADLTAWASIGARTTESQTHRQMASGLSMPVGYKNGTDGSLDNAINAMKAARHPHSFLGIDGEGRTGVVRTSGNSLGHLILRGGRSGPNYDSASVERAAEALRKADLPPRVMVDCSHANSNKDYRRQSEVWRDVIAQRVDGDARLIGLMLESNLGEGRQDLGSDPKNLGYGVSITDPCIGWEKTTELIEEAYARLGAVTPPAR